MAVDCGRRRCAGAWRSSRRGPAWPRAAATTPSASPSDTLAELGEGEGRTYARAHQVLAECAIDSDAREDLQRAAESYRVAASGLGVLRRVRPGPGLPARRWPSACSRRSAGSTRRWPRSASCSARPTSPTPSARGRAWSRGSCCCNANRLDSAESRFARVADLGYLHDNPRLIAARGVGHGARRVPPERPADGRCAGSPRAENTALGEADDMLGVPFLCDVAEMLGALGELDLADRVPRPGHSSASPCSPARCSSTTFMLDARKGVARRRRPRRSAHTLPTAWWRVKLVAAYAIARRRGPGRARRRLADDADRELVALGFSDFDVARRRARTTWSCRPRCARAPAGPRQPAERVPSAVAASSADAAGSS